MPNVIGHEQPLRLELFGDAKATAIRLAQRNQCEPRDVVARSLGTQDFLESEKDSGKRIVSENFDGTDRRLVVVPIRAGDAG